MTSGRVCFMPQNGEGHRQRLRERFLKTGLRGFSEHEVLELLLTLCIPRHDVKTLAKTLLMKFDSVRGVFEAEAHTLKTIKGLGDVSVCCIQLIKSFADYYLQQKIEKLPLFTNNDDLVHFWQTRIGHLSNEVVEVAYLDNAYHLLTNGIERLEEGATACANIYPQKILKLALLKSASYMVIAHNHPSGNCQPSQADFKITQTLQHISHALSLQLLDHIIVTRNDFYSFRQSGFLE